MPNPKELLELSGINTPLIGFYDVPEKEPFEPDVFSQHMLTGLLEKAFVFRWKTQIIQLPVKVVVIGLVVACLSGQ